MFSENPPVTHWDVHFYFDEKEPKDVQSAQEVWDAIHKQFPQCRIYPLVPKPVGPHPCGMWELHIETQKDFAQVVLWLSHNRRHHAVLVHPNALAVSLRRSKEECANEGILDHSERAVWLGQVVKLDLTIFTRHF
eukprot:TRINITY_DN1939_c0_g1_i1.p1 TRINITY_DN1939_c0_g1~~TRINITY_DN1939_c0_g1_i1.p1  ORF type:complete len:135 (-),score=31.85 TRINITY_DN1939_c0_g1_i1:120-524(-)